MLLRTFSRPLAPAPLLRAASCRMMSSTTKYRSTRGGQTGLKFDEAVLQGLATDRGLLVPEQIPSFPPGAPEVWRGLKFEELAYEIMSLYIGPNDIPPETLKDIINRSYATFRDPSEEPHPHSSAEDKNGRVTPVREITDGMHVLELFHGPTFAFKDVALQYLGNLFEELLKQRPGHTLTVVGATSGDTGSSAIHGLRGKAGVECFIMYPEGRTSRTQELQMISVTDPNIHNIALGGTFDDCQAVVKACFNDAEFRNKHNLAAVNSINWARILAQMVYYVYAYLKVTPPPASSKEAGSPPLVSFSVPTGNFGDILAGYYAKRMGLPIDQLVVATNQNDILHRFFNADGDYSLNANGVAQTLSPSMDIGVSSNFERFLFHMGGDDPKALNDMMTRFEAEGALKPPSTLVAASREVMCSASVADSEILETIKDVYARADGYTLDPHSAIGVAAARRVRPAGSTVPMVCLACAHWAKFPDANQLALGAEKAGALKVPPVLAGLDQLDTRVVPLPYDVGGVQTFIKKTLAERSS
jgi:threonine synthase